MPAVPILRQVAARRLAETFQAGDTIILVCARGYINALQHRPGKGYHVITPVVAAALDWPVRRGYLQASSRLTRLRVLKHFRLTSFVAIYDENVWYLCLLRGAR